MVNFVNPFKTRTAHLGAEGEIKQQDLVEDQALANVRVHDLDFPTRLGKGCPVRYV